MNLCSLYRVELRRLALSKFTWFFAALSLCGPLFGYAFYIQSNAAALTGRYIANPVLAGTVIGAVLWAGLTFLEADRVHRARADVLVDAVASPVRMALVRMAALITLSTAVCILCALAYLPYTMLRLDYLFTYDLYAISFAILMLPTWWISILLAAALYHIAKRVELAGLLYGALVYISLSRFVEKDFFFRWLNPLVATYSDGFPSLLYLRIALYTRLQWLALAGGLWALSLACIRRYQKNLLRSLWRGMRKVYLPVTAAALIAAGALMWIGQPFVNHGPAEWDNESRTKMWSTTGTYASEVSYRITVQPLLGRLHGVAEYAMPKYNEQPDRVWLDPGYRILAITCNGEPVGFEAKDEVLWYAREVEFQIPKGNDQRLIIEYEGNPTILRCFSPDAWYDISPDYITLSDASMIPIYTSFGIPADCTIELTLPGHLTPLVQSERLTEFTENADGAKTWRGEASSPAWRSSYSYSLSMTAANYALDTVEVDGGPVEYLYNRNTQQGIINHPILDMLAEVSVYCNGMLSGTHVTFEEVRPSMQAYAFNSGNGWIEGVLAASNADDLFKGPNVEAVVAHEMIHMWWGPNAISSGSEFELEQQAKELRSDGDERFRAQQRRPNVSEPLNELWSDEGLAVYTTYRFMKHKYGDAYAKEQYVDRWQAAVDMQERGFYYRHPEYLDRLPAQYIAELDNINRKTNLYCRMPLMILKAEQLVGGEEEMDEILRTIQSQFYEFYARKFTYKHFLYYTGLKAVDLNLE